MATVLPMAFLIFSFASGLGYDPICGNGGTVTAPAGTAVSGTGATKDDADEDAIRSAGIAAGASCPREICGWADCLLTVDLNNSRGTLQGAVYTQNPDGSWTVTATVGGGGYKVAYLCGCP